VAVNFLDRQGKLTKQWIPSVKRKMKQGKLTNLYRYLLRLAQNYVKDLHRKLVRQQGREVGVTDGLDDDERGVNLERLDSGTSLDPSSSTYAREVYEALVKGFVNPRSKKILDILIDQGITGFISGGRSRGGGVKAIAEAFNVTIQSVSQHYRPKFQEDVIRAIRRMRDPYLADAAKRMLASETDPMVKICLMLDRVRDQLHC